MSSQKGWVYEYIKDQVPISFFDYFDVPRYIIIRLFFI